MKKRILPTNFVVIDRPGWSVITLGSGPDQIPLVNPDDPRWIRDLANVWLIFRDSVLVVKTDVNKGRKRTLTCSIHAAYSGQYANELRIFGPN